MLTRLAAQQKNSFASCAHDRLRRHKTQRGRADESTMKNLKNPGQTTPLLVNPATGRRSLSASVVQLLSERYEGLPVWIRPPKVGTDFFCGLSRAKLYQAAAEGQIRTASLRSPGQTKGTRLFDLRSILQFIEKNEIRSTTPLHKR